MPIIFQTKTWQHLAVGLAAVLLLWSAYEGAQSGRLQAESRLVFQNAQVVTQGLEYFRKDQDRYPSSVEFGNPSLMLRYFDQFPPHEFRQAPCTESYRYQRPSQQVYAFAYCLAKAYGGSPEGWTQVGP